MSAGATSRIGARRPEAEAESGQILFARDFRQTAQVGGIKIVPLQALNELVSGRESRRGRHVGGRRWRNVES